LTINEEGWITYLFLSREPLPAVDLCAAWVEPEPPLAGAWSGSRSRRCVVGLKISPVHRLWMHARRRDHDGASARHLVGERT
jgi:hypothetical protein